MLPRSPPIFPSKDKSTSSFAIIIKIIIDTEEENMEELERQCQVCKTTEIEPGWRCTSCGRPICVSCCEEMKEVGKRMECLNPLCARNSRNSNRLVTADKAVKITIPAEVVSKTSISGTSLSSPMDEYIAGVNEGIELAKRKGPDKWAGETRKNADKWLNFHKRAFK